MEALFSRSKSVSKVRKVSPIQTTMDGLQKMVDKYISMCEYENTRSVFLDGEIRELKSQLLQHKQNSSVKKLNDQAQDTMTKLQQRAQYLEHQLEITLTKVSKTSTYNRGIRDEIDTLRLNSMTEKEKITKLLGQVESIAELNQQEVALTEREMSQTERLSMATMMLRSKSTSHRMKMNEKIMSLTVKPTQKSIKSDFKDTSIIRQHFTDHSYRNKGKAEVLEPTFILKRLKAKWVKKVEEAKSLVDTLSRSHMAMQSGLEQIRRATGLYEIDEITTAIVKSGEQNYALSYYVSNLHIDIEQIGLTHKRLRKAILAKATSTTCFDENSQKSKSELQLSIAKSHKRLAKLKVKADKVEEQLKLTEEIIVRMMENFDKHEFVMSLPTFMQESTIKDNLISSLLRLEAYIDDLVLFHAYKKKEQSPSLKLISAMANKIFHRDRDPIREVLKLNDMLTDYANVVDEPLSSEQLKMKARQKIDIVNKITIDELPSLVRKKSNSKRVKTPLRTPKLITLI